MSQKATWGSGWRKGIQNKLKRRGSLILAPIFALSVISTSTGFSSVSQASVEPGIDVTVYNNFGYNASPPLPEVSGRQVTGTTTYANINQNFDAAPPFNLYEDFIVKYEGHITSPITGDILFWPWADDGTMFYLDGVLIDPGNWVDKGGSGNETGPQSFIAGTSKPFTYWFYENGGGAWTTLYWNLGNGWEIVPPSAFTKTATVAPTTTTLAPYFNPVTNLQGVAKPDGSVDLSWEQPAPSNLDIFAYTVSFFKLEQGAESGGWGIWTDNTLINLGPWMWTGTTGYGDIRFKIRPGTAACFAPSNLQCQYGPEQSIDLLVEDPTPPTTTTLPPIIIETTTTTIPIVEETIPAWTTTTTVASIPTVTVETTEVATTSTTTTTQAPILQQTEQPQTTTTTLPPPITTTTTLPPEQKAPVPEAATIALIQTVDELKKLVETVDLETIEADQAVALVTNAAFIELPKDQLSEVFESLPISDLSPEQEAVLVATLSDAPSEVKNTFESAVDVYGSGLDEYVPEGSSVDVGTRRSVIAVTTVMATVAAAGAAPGAGGGQPSGGNSGGSGGSPSDANKAARREEEQEDEEAGGLEGPEDREKNLNTRNSIYTYKENGQKEFSIMGFIKKFLKETAALSFTLAGSAIMFVTLSGDTRRIAMIATAAALTVHYIYVMLENDEE
jgi:hypothetical protein